MKKLISMFTTMLLVMMMSVTVMASPADSQVIGEVDWGNGDIEGVGVGIAPPTALNPGHAKALARRAAIVNAYRAIAETAQGVNIDGESTVENLMLTNEITKTKITAVVKGAVITNESYDSDGTYTVTMKVRLFGNNSVASAILPTNTNPEPFRVVPATSIATGNYTGVVIDCSGLGLKTAMSPVIKNESGESVYGYKNLDSNYVINKGMAGYTRDVNDHNRAGINPMIIKAVGLIHNNTYPIISDADANRILSENNATGFLNKCAVVFVR